MKSKSEGSIVLLMVMVMGMITVLMLAAIQEGAFLQMFVHKHIYAEQQRSLARSLLVHGIALAKKNYKQLIDQEEVELELDLNDKIGRIFLKGLLDQIKIVAMIGQKSQTSFVMECQLKKLSDNNFTVQGFQS